jgi:hypothetical protein
MSEKSNEIWRNDTEAPRPTKGRLVLDRILDRAKDERVL